LSYGRPQPSCQPKDKIKGWYVAGNLPFFKALVSLLKPAVKKQKCTLKDLAEKKFQAANEGLGFPRRQCPVLVAVAASAPRHLGDAACSLPNCTVTERSHTVFIQRQTKNLGRKSRQGGQTVLPG